MSLLVPPAADGTGARVHVGRQPIYDADGAVVGYELLFRASPDSSAAAESGAGATSRVISNAFTQFGLDNLVGERYCFLNVTREFVVGDLPLPFDPGRVVLEVLETIDVDDEVVDGVARLVAEGYLIALDDLLLGGDHERLLPLAHFVKLDWSQVAGQDLAPTLERLHGLGLTVVAERLEDDADVRRARELGFDLLQGYALARPATLSLEVLDPGDLRRLELLATLSAEDLDLPRIVSLIATDPALGLRVLRATGSAAVGLRHRVSSVREAVVILGTTRIRQWVTLMIAADVCGAGEEHLAALVTRARMCQTVAERLEASGDAGFTVGMLSGISETLVEPVEDLVARLPLSDAVAGALVRGAGPLGEALDVVLAYESGRDPGLLLAAPAPISMAQAHLAAVAWATQTLSAPLG